MTYAAQLFLAQREERVAQGDRSQETVDFYERKCGQLLRVFARPELLGPPLLLAGLTADVVDGYISQRRREWADDAETRRVTDHTIAKELGTLRAVLRLAKRRGLWKGDTDDVLPGAGELSADYQPRERALSREELPWLLAALDPDRGAQVAYMVATSAEWGAVERAERGDATLDKDNAPTAVLVRGTKRATRWRVVPLVTEWQRSLVRRALDHAEGKAPALFAPWGNVRRDLHTACVLAGHRRNGCDGKHPDDRRVACTKPECLRLALAPCSPNDLRRTAAQWLKREGAPNELVAPVMGHADTRMLERVYGRLTPEVLAERLSAVFGLSVPPAVTPVSRTGRTGSDLPDASDGVATRGACVSPENLVPRDGIEPPTRGFSVPAHLWPSPRKKRTTRKSPVTGVTPVSRRSAKAVGSRAPSDASPDSPSPRPTSTRGRRS